MNEVDLNNLLKRAALTTPKALLLASEPALTEKLRSDDGRARRWLFFVRLLLIGSLVSGVATAGVVCWRLASQDKTHTTPPTMCLFKETPSA
jgi:hypothetical protein